MSINPEYNTPEPREIVFNNYGVYIVTDKDAYPLTEKQDPVLDDNRTVVLVSQPDWQNTLETLEHNQFGKSIVLTPELITVAGYPLATMSARRDEVEKALSDASEVSRQQPDATFIIGSPYFPNDDYPHPYNAAVVIKAGKVRDVARKKLLGADEMSGFTFHPQFFPTKVEDATLLVCRDLIGAQKTRLKVGYNGVSNYVLQTTKDHSLAHQFENAEFIAPGTRRILVEACWGVGAPQGALDRSSKEEIDNYYFLNLRGMAHSLLRLDRNIDQVVVCDRSVVNPRGNIVASKPMSAVFFRS